MSTTPGVVYLRVNRRFLLLPNPPTCIFFSFGWNWQSQHNFWPTCQYTKVRWYYSGLARPCGKACIGSKGGWHFIHVSDRDSSILVESGDEQVLEASDRRGGIGGNHLWVLSTRQLINGPYKDLWSQIDPVVDHPSREEVAFRDTFLAQHTQCIISQVSYDRVLTASHLIPACLGDDVVQYIFKRFTGLSNPVTRHHQSIVVPLNLFFNTFVAAFNLGFWHRGDVRFFSLYTLPCVNAVLCRMNTKFMFSYRSSWISMAFSTRTKRHIPSSLCHFCGA